MMSSRYAACSSSSITCSILVLSNVLFLCQISVIFVSCTQRSRLTFVSYSLGYVSHYSCAYRFLLNSCHVRGWFACGTSESSGAFVSYSQLLRGIVKFHLTIMRYECSFASTRISLFSKFATVGTGHELP